MARSIGSLRHVYNSVVSVLTNNLVRWDHRKYTVCPGAVDSVVDDDAYTLLAPVRRGDVRVVSDGHVLVDGEVRPGMLRFTAPGERVKVSIRSPAEHIIFLIPGSDMRRILDTENSRAHGRKSYIDPLMRPDRFVAQAAAASLCIDEFGEGHRQLYIDGLAYTMLARLLAARSNRNDSYSQSHCKILSDQEFDRCCQYADAMMDTKLCLDQWASLVDLPITEFTRRFRQRTQQSPYAWFMNRRIARAKTLLVDGKTPLAEVAFSVGFCSQSHFTEAFRRREGCSPGRWRVLSGAGS